MGSHKFSLTGESPKGKLFIRSKLCFVQIILALRLLVIPRVVTTLRQHFTDSIEETYHFKMQIYRILIAFFWSKKLGKKLFS